MVGNYKTKMFSKFCKVVLHFWRLLNGSRVLKTCDSTPVAVYFIHSLMLRFKCVRAGCSPLNIKRRLQICLVIFCIGPRAWKQELL